MSLSHKTVLKQVQFPLYLCMYFSSYNEGKKAVVLIKRVDPLLWFMDAVLIAFYQSELPNMKFESNNFLSHLLWLTSRWSQASTNNPTCHYLANSPHGRGSRHDSSTLYSWTIPFWLSSGGGCQVTTIAVPFPSFLVTETLWGGALGAVWKEGVKVSSLHAQVGFCNREMVSGLHKCILLCFNPLTEGSCCPLPTRQNDTEGKQCETATRLLSPAAVLLYRIG